MELGSEEKYKWKCNDTDNCLWYSRITQVRIWRNAENSENKQKKTL